MEISSPRIIAVLLLSGAVPEQVKRHLRSLDWQHYSSVNLGMANLLRFVLQSRIALMIAESPALILITVAGESMSLAHSDCLGSPKADYRARPVGYVKCSRLGAPI